MSVIRSLHGATGTVPARLSALALAGVFATATPAMARSAPTELADLIDTVSPAVVQIMVKHDARAADTRPGEKMDGPEQFREGPFKEFFERFFREGRPEGMRPGPMPRPHGLGSGFIIDEDGIVVTNHHVVRDAAGIEIKLKDGREFDAKLLGADAKTDLAVLKIASDATLPFVQWGDSDDTRVGDWVLAVGNPFGLGGSVTAGIVSGRGRDIGSGPYDDFIQVDAPINRGNSGGPLFNLDGKVIGVNTAIFSPNGGSVGIGFAIPAALARDVVAELQEKGVVERGWLGVSIQPVGEDIAESLGMKTDEGALIAHVNPNSPAEKSGLQQGDVILRFDGSDIDEIRDLTRAVADTSVGTEAKVLVWRDDEESTLTVTVGEMPGETVAAARQAEEGVELGTLGMTLAELDEKARGRFGLAEDADGILVTKVDPATGAAEKGIRPGDLIISVNRKPVSSVDAVLRAIEHAEDKGRKAVLLLVKRGDDERFVALETGAKVG